MLLIKITKSGKILNYDKKNIDFLKNNKNINRLNIWTYENIDFVLYGCKNGSAGEENKFELPPPVDCELYFNDLYFIKYENNNIVDLDKNTFNEFYENCFGGFEDIENTDDEEEEEYSEHTSDLEFINDNSEISVCSNTIELDLSSFSTFSNSIEIKNTTEKDCDLDLSSLDITVSSCSSISNDDIQNLVEDLEEINTESKD